MKRYKYAERNLLIQKNHYFKEKNSYKIVYEEKILLHMPYTERFVSE